MLERSLPIYSVSRGVFLFFLLAEESSCFPFSRGVSLLLVVESCLPVFSVSRSVSLFFLLAEVSRSFSC